MSCCGKARSQASAPGPIPARHPNYGTVVFEYTGQTALSVVGPVSRATYHFASPGARAAVDSRDSVSLAAVRALRRV
ncbi:MAG TPA: hypothetical protein VIX89_10040 [Bryobacteraceae bacterium]